MFECLRVCISMYMFRVLGKKIAKFEGSENCLHSECYSYYHEKQLGNCVRINVYTRTALNDSLSFLLELQEKTIKTKSIYGAIFSKHPVCLEMSLCTCMYVFSHVFMYIYMYTCMHSKHYFSCFRHNNDKAHSNLEAFAPD